MTVLTIISSILGMILGSAGLAISILNYLRDRSKVKVTLQWNMKDTRTGAVHSVVRVTNVGRRTVFINVAALEVADELIYILNDSISGVRLAEADQPKAFLVNHDGLEQHAAIWRKIRAFVVLSTGEKFWSSYPDKHAKPPKWAASRS